MTRVLVADDHPAFRRGLDLMLQDVDDVDLVGEAATAQRAVELAEQLSPDVILMDLRMPDLDGIEATRRITHRSPRTAVVVLTMFDDDDSVFEAMRAGAFGYLLKGADQDEIVRAIRAAAAGEAIFGRDRAAGDRTLRDRREVGPGRVPVTDRAGARGARPGRLGQGQRRHRPRADDQSQDGAQPCLQHLHQAPGVRPVGRHRQDAGRRPRWVLTLTV